MGGHHEAHALATLPAELLAEHDRPTGIGTTMMVDTRTPIDVDALAGAIQAIWTSVVV